MNIANKLTLLRILLVPFFVVFVLSEAKGLKLFGSLIFVVAALTDMLDGHLARSRNLVTTFGKFLDPLADKILTSAAMILLVELGVIKGWLVIIVIFREFAITGLRVVAASEQITIAAGTLGKIKTIFQLVSLTIILFALPLSLTWMLSLGKILFYISVIFTVLSGIEYIGKNIKVFDLSNI